MSKKTFYVTTPLYYVNAAPHIGHAYTTVAADVLNRFMKSRGAQTFFLTGTDEHGAKIAEAAAAAGLSPQAYADDIAGKFKDLWAHLDIRYDDFIRTTEDRHRRCVQEVFSTLLKSGDIYKGRYTGHYCVSCESYWTDTEAPADEKKKRVCPNAECGKPLQVLEEDSYFFKLSKYEKPLLELYKKNPAFLSPSRRGNEIKSFVEGGLRDISVSRTKIRWGIPVPGDPESVIYVWFDALLNYISAAGFAGRGRDAAERFKALWPADAQIVGKEIFRFHAVIWPAMLLALGVEPPAKVFAHGWWTVEGEKMSKSKGNFIDPREITLEFGVDALRYFMLREIPFGNDGNFSHQALLKRYNADLANDLGNLVSRVVQMVDKYLQGTLPARPPEDKPLHSKEVIEQSLAIDEAMMRLGFSEALDMIWAVIKKLNQSVDAQAPWKTAKTDPERVKVILFDLVWSLRIVAGWIDPFMPRTAAKIQSQLGVRRFPSPLTPDEVLKGPNGDKIQKGPPLFPRKS